MAAIPHSRPATWSVAGAAQRGSIAVGIILVAALVGVQPAHGVTTRRATVLVSARVELVACRAAGAPAGCISPNRKVEAVVPAPGPMLPQPPAGSATSPQRAVTYRVIEF